MGLLLDAARCWNDLHDVKYILDVARKGSLERVELSFLYEDFPHLAGMQYARDVDFGIRRSEYYGERLIPALLDKNMIDTKMEESRNWERITGRLKAIVNLQNVLDGEFTIVFFNKKKVRGFSQIEARFAIRSVTWGDVYFIFLDERSGRYYCKSAFRKETIDYTENQSIMAVLQKSKITAGKTEILYTRSGYCPDS